MVDPRNCVGFRVIAQMLQSQGRDHSESIRLAEECEKAVEIEPTVNLPPVWIRGVNFSAAMARWIAAGRPMRTQEEIDERLAICQSCPQFVDNVCQKCGCQCIEENSIFNKLALATESCPEGYWK